MKTRIFLISGLVLCTLFSCQVRREAESPACPDTMTFHAANGDGAESKTILQENGTKIYWSPGDAINLFSGEGSARFVTHITEMSYQADFTGSLAGFSIQEGSSFWAVYPYRTEHQFDGNAVTLLLPDEQAALEGTFDNNLFLTMARTQDSQLLFYNVCGGVKFSVAHEGIRSVVFRGNANEILAGSVKAGFDAQGKPVVREVLDGKREIRLQTASGACFEPGKWYYIVALPVTLSKGYTLSFYGDAPLGDRASSQSVTIKRAVWGALDKADGNIVTYDEPEIVDMGLSVKWASFNLGAYNTEDSGPLYAWGETDPKDSYAWENYRWSNGTSDRNTLTKYCNNPKYGLNGFVDDKVVLDPEDDAATVHLGGLWRIPTKQEWIELTEASNCSWTWTEINGVKGYQVKSLKNGGTLFFPVQKGKENWGAYWSSGIVADEPNGAVFAWELGFTNERYLFSYIVDRANGQCVRPVYAPLFRLSPTQKALTEEGETFTVEVVSSLSYEISSIPDWISAVSSKSAGLNRTIHTFRAPANDSGADRSGVIVFCNESGQCVPFNVSQTAPVIPTLETDATSISFTSDAGEKHFTISSNLDWSIVSSQSWCQVSPASGNGDASVSVSVTANASEEVRSAVLTVTGGDFTRTITVSQEGVQAGSDFDWTQTFYHRSLVMRFTATWCGYCPNMATSVHLAQEQNPGKLEALNLHGSQSNLEFSGTRVLMNQYAITGYPSGIVDGRQLVQNYGSSYAASLIGQYAAETEQNYPVSSAIGFESSLSGRTLDVHLSLYLRYAADYKVVVMLLESGIVGYQADNYDGNHTDYVHNDIARLALTDVSGDSFTTTKNESVKTFNYSVAVPSACNLNNLKILVYVQRAYGNQTVLSSGSYGDYYVDNCASGKAGGSLPVTVVSSGGGGNEGFEEGEPINW